MNAKNWKNRAIFFLAGLWLVSLLSLSACTKEISSQQIWPEITSQTKPWTRWWWMGNAVDKANITRQLEAFQLAGIGGVEITPIYGVKGYESSFIEYLSPEWLEMLEHTLNEAQRLGLQVDMVMGTGWPFGGPQVEPEYAASKLVLQKYPLKAGQDFDQDLNINDRKQQGLAILQKVIFVDEQNATTDISPLLNQNHLSYTSKTAGTVYALFCAKTRQQVKRSAPGGQGYVLNHFSKDAFDDYAIPFEGLKPFQGKLRSIFNDSYEVYGADYSPEFLQEFKDRRGYELTNVLSQLEGNINAESYQRLLCDYRETAADMLLNNFAKEWRQWSNNHGFKIKYQAHGSPGNLIDLYAAADIPECEVFGSPKYDIPGYRRDTNEVRKGDSNKMMFKFASSAAHLQGSELVSSETFTWLREHFKTTLGQCKPLAEELFLSGVNHIFLHGSTYSPTEDNWPGWKFYASVNFNPSNTIFHDADALFNYIARCQSILQNTKNNNNILLYWPLYDAYTHTDPGNLLHAFSIHSIDEWLLPTSFYKAAYEMDSKGYFFDFISEQFIEQSQFKDSKLIVGNKTSYQALVVPDMDCIPLATMQKLIELKKAGANIIFLGKPETVPGTFQYQEREMKLKKLLDENKVFFEVDKPFIEQLKATGIEGETISEYGLQALRKQWNGDVIYYIVNHSANAIDTFVPFQTKANSVLLMDALSEKTGKAKIESKGNETKVKLQLEPGQSLFVKMSNKEIVADALKYIKTKEKAETVHSKWSLSFVHGGPVLPESVELNQLHSWTSLGESYSNFSGTAVYSTHISMEKDENKGYLLDLGDVRESARVKVNGQDAGTVFAIPYTIDITPYLRDGDNELHIEVTNLAANRLSALERSGYEWKRFYEINMVNINYLEFDAKNWTPTPSGLIGEVKIVPLEYE